MHSSTPDSENQSFLLSDYQNSSKVLALVQHIGCLSKERTPTYFTVLQSLKNNLSYQSVLVGLCLDNFCICQCLLPHTTNVWSGIFCLVGLGFLFFILIIIILWIGNVWIGKPKIQWIETKQKKYAKPTSCLLIFSLFKKSISWSLMSSFCLTSHVQI